MILDEVFATGDAGFIEKAERLLKQKIDSVPISIMVNHSIGLIGEMCNKVFILDSGRLYAEGETSEMLKKYDTEIIKG